MEDLLEILRSLHPDVDFETEEYLIDKGILDSMDIVSLISEINDAFEVRKVYCAGEFQFGRGTVCSDTKAGG